jgi:hypothetical protein
MQTNMEGTHQEPVPNGKCNKYYILCPFLYGKTNKKCFFRKEPTWMFLTCEGES